MLFLAKVRISMANRSTASLRVSKLTVRSPELYVRSRSQPRMFKLIARIEALVFGYVREKTAILLDLRAMRMKQHRGGEVE